MKHTIPNLYAPRDIITQGDSYTRHVEAMTREGLHSKSDIAAELAHRDDHIAALEVELAEQKEISAILRKRIATHEDDNARITSERDEALSLAHSRALVIEDLTEDAERYRWLANRVLACDYGDNDAPGEQIGWRIRWNLMEKDGERQPAFMYGKTINSAIDAARKEGA